MFNIFEKIYTLQVSKEIRIHHYPCAKEKKFVYWLIPSEDIAGHMGHRFDSLEVMIEEAYRHIDPLLKPVVFDSIPEQCC